MLRRPRGGSKVVVRVTKCCMVSSREGAIGLDRRSLLRLHCIEDFVYIAALHPALRTRSSPCITFILAPGRRAHSSQPLSSSPFWSSGHHIYYHARPTDANSRTALRPPTGRDTEENGKMLGQSMKRRKRLNSQRKSPSSPVNQSGNVLFLDQEALWDRSWGSRTKNDQSRQKSLSSH